LYWVFGGILFLQGIGMGFSMMPLFSGAMQTLRRSQIANASTALNIMQQVSASVGTAVLSVVLTNEIVKRTTAAAANAAAAGGGQGQQPTPDELKHALAPVIAPAFGATFWWAVGLVAVAVVVAAVLLPKNKPEPLEDDEAEDAPAAMMMG